MTKDKSLPAEQKNKPVNCVHEIVIDVPTDFGTLRMTIQTGAVEQTEMLEKSPHLIVDHKLIEKKPIPIEFKGDQQ